MTSMSIEQALDVWDQLEDAKEGKSSYGGDVAEIYAYRLNPHSPRMVLGGEGEEEFGPRFEANLKWLVAMFEKKRGCKVEILDDTWFHRVHVKVTKLGKD
jgi:hypothetical protein